MPKSKNNPSEKKTVRGITTRVRTALENTARQLQLSAEGLPIASGEKPINVIVAFSGALHKTQPIRWRALKGRGGRGPR